MNTLLEDFLSIGKLEEGKIAVELTTTNLKLLIGEAVTELQFLHKKEQQVLIRYEGNESTITDRKLVRHILLNLLSNALKFSGEKKVVQITTIVSSKGIAISITDRGIGISKADQIHLFETFFRGKNAQNIHCAVHLYCQVGCCSPRHPHTLRNHACFVAHEPRSCTA